MLKKISAFILLFLVVLSIQNPVDAASDDQMIVINKKINKLAFYDNGKLVKIYSVATGKKASFTPEGKFKIVNKIKNRPYYSGNIPGGDVRNPLGDRWLGINARGTWGTTYAIHGNNNPSSIGTYASSGCVRMYDNDVRELFSKVAVNTPVVITTSSKSFDSIAKTNGYHIGPIIVKYEKDITIFDRENLHNSPSTSTYTGGTVDAQLLSALERSGDWYKVNTWMGPKWINTKNVIEGKISTFEKDIKLTEKSNLYLKPISNSKTSSAVGAQNLKAHKKVGNWYLVDTWIGQRWVYATNVEIPTTDKEIEKQPDVVTTPNKPTIPEEPIIDYKKTITLFERATLYEKTDTNYNTGASVEGQYLNALQKKGDWYLINTWMGPKWINSKSILDGKIEKVGKTITTVERHSLYKSPFESNQVSSIAPQTVNMFEEIGDWKHIRTWLGDMWIKSN